MNKTSLLKVTVIMGGPSAEHEVSLATGREILMRLDRKKYHIQAVVVSREKEFYICDAQGNVPSLADFSQPGACAAFRGPMKPGASQPIWENTDVAVLGLHGEFGEDGLIQGFLDTAGVAYTGSGVFASSVGMNKIAAKIIFESGGLTTPPSSVCGLNNPEVTVDILEKKHGFPCFVKCPQSGSSRLMGQALDRAGLQELITDLSKHADELLVETAITGDEYSCPVLHYPDGTIKALPPILIKPASSSFFDYTAKYTDGASQEIVPAPCSPELTSRIQEAAVRADELLQCSGLSRTDIIEKNGVLYVLEINTLPGLTPASLAPKAFAAAGGTFSGLLDILIETAMQKKRNS